MTRRNPSNAAVGEGCRVASRFFGWMASLLGVAFATGLGGCAYGPPSADYDTELLRIKGTVRSKADKRPMAGVLVRTAFLRDSLRPNSAKLDTTGADGTYQATLPAGIHESGILLRVHAAALDSAVVPGSAADTVFAVDWTRTSGSGSKDATVDLDLGAGN